MCSSDLCVREASIGFFFAPTFHPSMRHAGPTRRALGIRTAFNLLGPLTNPAGALRQIVGVSRPELTELLARALALLGSVGPTLGTKWIVDAFLVVILGGIGQLIGTVIAAMSIGWGNVVLEFWSTAALAKVPWETIFAETGIQYMRINTIFQLASEEPSRLARAKLACEDLIRESGTDRLGLVAFAGDAFLQCPLALDVEAFRQSVRARLRAAREESRSCGSFLGVAMVQPEQARLPPLE